MDTTQFRIRTLGSFTARYALTLGLYWPWLLYSWAADLYRASGQQQPRPLWVMGTTVLTLGFGALYWHWRIARELVGLGMQRGVRVDPNLPTYVLIASGLSVVVSALSGGVAILLGLVFAAGACWMTQNAFNALAIEPARTG